MITKYLTRNKRINTRDHDIVVTVNCRTDSFGHTFHTIDLAFDEELSVGYVSRVLAELAARLLDTTDTIPPGHTAFCHAPAAHTRESEKEPR